MVRMTSIAHVATGAFVASVLPHPVLYIPIAVGLHYLADWTPHWDFGTGLSTGKRSRRTAAILGTLDLLAGLALVYALWQAPSSAIQYHIWAGAIAGILPDLMEAPRNFLKWEPAFLKPFNDFHESVHVSITNVALGIFPQVIVVGYVVLTSLWR